MERGLREVLEEVIDRGGDKDEFSKSGKDLGGNWEGYLERRQQKGKSWYHMIRHFQCDLCLFRSMKVMDLNSQRTEDQRLMINIRQEYLYTFWSRQPGTVRGNLNMLRKLGVIQREYLGLDYLFPPLGTYPLKYEVGMGVAWVTLILYLSKGVHFGNIQWGIVRKAPMKWYNLYGSVLLGMGDTIYAIYGKNFTQIA